MARRIEPPNVTASYPPAQGEVPKRLGPIFKDDTGTGDIHLRMSRFAVIASTTVLEGIGLFAGLLPALKASRLDPIEALRYE